MLREDYLGLGAKRGSDRADNFGLAGLESVLGRLNGRAVEVEKEDERRAKIQHQAHMCQKYGFMNFVSAGFLVGDKIEKSVKKDAEVKIEVKSEPERETEAGDKKSKKRKRSREDEAKQEDQLDEHSKLKRKKKSMNLRDVATEEEASATEPKPKDKKSKKSKKALETLVLTDTPVPSSDAEPHSDRARRKAEKCARKEEKRLKKALKKAAKEAAKEAAKLNHVTEDAASASNSEEERTQTIPATTAGASTPVGSAAGLTYHPRGMHAVRQRYIRQKKMANMNPQALKEVRCLHFFMRW